MSAATWPTLYVGDLNEYMGFLKLALDVADRVNAPESLRLRALVHRHIGDFPDKFDIAFNHPDAPEEGEALPDPVRPSPGVEAEAPATQDPDDPFSGPDMFGGRP